MRHLLVLRHGPLVGPDLLRSPLDGRAATLPWVEHDLDDDPRVPALTDQVAGLLVLGGRMNTDDDDPWLEPERQLLRDAVAAGVPVLGVCLGAQQLAVALGGTVVHRESGRHAAVTPLTRTDAGTADRVLAGWPDGAPAYFHHGDEVATLPEGARDLLVGGDGAHPAWVDASGTAYAVQFHPEASASRMHRWAQFDAEERGVELDDALLDQVDATEPFVRAAGVSLVMRWVDQEVASRV